MLCFHRVFEEFGVFIDFLRPFLITKVNFSTHCVVCSNLVTGDRTWTKMRFDKLLSISFHKSEIEGRLIIFEV